MTPQITVPEEDVIAWRRHLHAHPELSFEEHRTAAFVEEKLRSFGIETHRPTETSVVGTIHGTQELPDGGLRCIALRADIDALPVQEESGLEFASTVPGVMHACGHDAHTAMLLGTAQVLTGMTDRFGGTVKLIFQHAEEKNPGGAKGIVEAGVLEGVDQIYGIHVMNGPVGTVQIAHGVATSSAGGCFLTITGVGSHGSMPHKGTDPLICAADVVVALNHIVSRDIDPWAFCVVNVGMLQCGAAPNVISDSAKLGISIRTFGNEEYRTALRRVEEVVDGVCRAYGCGYEFQWVPPYDVVENGPEAVRIATAAAQRAVGEENVVEVGPTSASEDFSAFTQVVPGCFIFLCAGDESDGLPHQNHHPGFGIREDVLAHGVRTEVQLVLETLGRGGDED